MIQVPAITYNEKMRWAGGGRKRVTKERGWIESKSNLIGRESGGKIFMIQHTVVNFSYKRFSWLFLLSPSDNQLS
jgi:hypothetical protein